MHQVRRRHKKFVSSCCEFIPCKEPSAPACARARVLFPAPNAESRARTARDALEPRRLLRGGVHAERKGVGWEANWVQTSPRPRKSRFAAPKRVRTLTFGTVEQARRVRAHGLALQGRRRTLGERRVRDGARSSMARGRQCAGCIWAVGKRRTARADVLGRAARLGVEHTWSAATQPQ
ncbi:hypothetical protein DFH09DRAFT_224760 [Mycena vulgaris]|nr:hypothetical protein DFH09DRAFT_224760 [Mycena vulgaris]